MAALRGGSGRFCSSFGIATLAGPAEPGGVGDMEGAIAEDLSGVRSGVSLAERAGAWLKQGENQIVDDKRPCIQ
jgi:hypothetical protein